MEWKGKENDRRTAYLIDMPYKYIISPPAVHTEISCIPPNHNHIIAIMGINRIGTAVHTTTKINQCPFPIVHENKITARACVDTGGNHIISSRRERGGGAD